MAAAYYGFLSILRRSLRNFPSARSLNTDIVMGLQEAHATVAAATLNVNCVCQVRLARLVPDVGGRVCAVDYVRHFVSCRHLRRVGTFTGCLPELKRWANL